MKSRYGFMKRCALPALSLVLVLFAGCKAAEEKPVPHVITTAAETAEAEKETEKAADTEKAVETTETAAETEAETTLPSDPETEARTEEASSELDGRFEQDNLVLKEMPASGPPLENLVLTDGFKAYYKAELNEEPDLERILEDARDAAEEDPPQILSLSPTGTSGLADFGGILLPFYDSHYSMLYPSAEHGAEDRHGSMDYFIQRTVQRIPMSFMNQSEVAYSPDGRYAVIQSPSMFLTRFNTVIPVLINLTSGEMVLIQDVNAHPASPKDFESFITGAFSADGQFFYYTVLGSFEDGRDERLYRYDIAKDSSELCTAFGGEYASYAVPAELRDGSWITLCEEMHHSSDEISGGYFRFSEENGAWTASWMDHPLKQDLYVPARLLYSSDSGYAVTNTAKGKIAFQVLRPEGGFEGADTYYCIDGSTEEIVPFSAQEYQDFMQGSWKPGDPWPYLSLLRSPELSPDGNYLLLFAAASDSPMDAEMGRISDYHLYLLRLEDMKLKQVQGIDPEGLRALASYPGSSYEPFFEWNSDRLIIRSTPDYHIFAFE